MASCAIWHSQSLKGEGGLCKKLLRFVQTSNMVANFVIAANMKGKAAVWKYFGFIKEKEDSAINNTRVGCRLCPDSAEIQREYDEPDGPHAS